jgi:hypothetical protein
MATTHLGNLSLKGDLAVAGDADVAGDAQIGGDAAVDGDATVTGTLTAGALQLSSPVWTDLDFPLIVRTTGPNIPVLTAISGNITAPQWQVNDYIVCEGQELVHTWEEGSTIYWHMHLLTNGEEATAKYVAFEVEWCIANAFEPLVTPAVIQSGDLEIPANTPDKTMLILSLAESDLTGYRIGAHIWPRLKRVAATGDAPADDPWATMLQAHIRNNTLGSSAISSK